jgi:hypothetical protein
MMGNPNLAFSKRKNTSLIQGRFRENFYKFQIWILCMFLPLEELFPEKTYSKKFHVGGPPPPYCVVAPKM